MLIYKYWLITILLCGPVSSSFADEKLTRTILLSFDGASDEFVDQMHSDGLLPVESFFRRSAKLGYRSERLTPINIANTGPSHAALFSGASPSDSGIVAQNFATPYRPLPERENAFSFPPSGGAQTIVNSARLAGKKTACIIAPGLDARSANHLCDYQLSFSPAIGLSSVITLIPSKASDATLPTFEHDYEYMIPLTIAPQTKLSIQTKKTLTTNQITFFHADTVLDGKRHYDTLLIRDRSNQIHDISGQKIHVYQHREEDARAATSLYLNSEDATAAGASLYWGQTFRTVANEAMNEAVIKKIGAWPGSLDATGLRDKRISQKGFIEHIHAYSKYIFDATTLMLERDDWDLLIAYVPMLDSIQHEFLMIDSRQMGFKKNHKKYQSIVLKAYRNIDQWMMQLSNNSNSSRTNFVVVSDHGMVPNHTTLAINTLLTNFGYKTEGEKIDLRAYTSGASAHLYINSIDRIGGHIGHQQKEIIIENIIEKLSSLTSPDGEKVFALVKNKRDQKELGLAHNGNSGDIFISANYGFGLDPRQSPTNRIFYPSGYDRQLLKKLGLSNSELEYAKAGTANRNSLGVHGHTANVKGISALIYALGPNVSNQSAEPMHMLQVAPTIACLLKIPSPSLAKQPSESAICKRSK